MDKIKVLIVDDEELARAELVRLLAFFDEIEVVAQADSARAGLSQVRNHPDLDLVFLDIDMPDVSGLNLAPLLADYPCKIVFCTAYAEYALQAFELNLLDYLTKPVSPQRLAQCIKKFKDSAGASRPRATAAMDTPLMVKNGEQIKLITPSQIEKLFSVGNYVKVSGEGLDMLIEGTLASLMQRLDPRYFFRANRSYVVNLQKVKDIELAANGAYVLTLRDGLEVEVSRRQSQLLKQLISL